MATEKDANMSAAKAAWNGFADRYNQWDNLSLAEQENLTASFRLHADRSAAPLAEANAEAMDFILANFGSLTDPDNAALWSDPDAFEVFQKLQKAQKASNERTMPATLNLEEIADLFDRTQPNEYGVQPFPRTDYGEKTGDPLLADCIIYGKSGSGIDADANHMLFAIKLGRALAAAGA